MVQLSLELQVVFITRGKMTLANHSSNLHPIQECSSTDLAKCLVGFS